MKNPFANRCPVCRSDDLKDPDGFMPPLYAMKPIECNGCGAKFEPNIVGRIGLWLFMSLLFLFVFTQKYLTGFLGREIFGVIFLVYLGLFFFVLVAAAVAELFRPRQFTLWSERGKLRAVVNYGSLISVIVYAIIFYSCFRTGDH